MSAPGKFTLEHAVGVPEQIRAIGQYANAIHKTREFARLLRAALHKLQSDPNEWGAPEYKAKTVNAIIRRGIIRPVVFRYAVYDDDHVVVLLNVRVFADFD
jgi:hypothetical protein